MVALLDSTGGRRWGGETIAYSAYGTPFGKPAADVNGSGAVNVTDFNLVSSASGDSYGDPGYTVLKDINLDGTIDSTDSSILSGQFGYTLGHGALSRSASLSGGVGNRIGYAGYAWEPASTKYHVRHRVLDPLRGRWSRRDPLGYVDSPTLFAYINNQALSGVDPHGLARLALQPEPRPSGSFEGKNPPCLAFSGIDGIDDYGSAPTGTNCTGGSGSGDSSECHESSCYETTDTPLEDPFEVECEGLVGPGCPYVCDKPCNLEDAIEDSLDPTSPNWQPHITECDGASCTCKEFEPHPISDKPVYVKKSYYQASEAFPNCKTKCTYTILVQQVIRRGKCLSTSASPQG